MYAPWAVTIFSNILQISILIIIVSCEAFLVAIYTGMNIPAKKLHYFRLTSVNDELGCSFAGSFTVVVLVTLFNVIHLWGFN